MSAPAEKKSKGKVKKGGKKKGKKGGKPANGKRLKEIAKALA